MTAPDAQGRFPGLAVMRQAPCWDEATALTIRSRVAPPAAPRFFTAAEQATARALVGQLLGQPHDDLGVPVMEMIDARLADGQTDGWRYEDMPEDGQAWRDTLAHLDTDAKERFVLSGREVYAWHPEGVARSKLWNMLAGKGLGVTATARNWTTVTKLLELAGASRAGARGGTRPRAGHPRSGRARCS